MPGFHGSGQNTAASKESNKKIPSSTSLLYNGDFYLFFTFGLQIFRSTSITIMLRLWDDARAEANCHKLPVSAKVARRVAETLMGDNLVGYFLIPDCSDSEICDRLVTRYSMGNRVW